MQDYSLPAQYFVTMPTKVTKGYDCECNMNQRLMTGVFPCYLSERYAQHILGLLYHTTLYVWVTEAASSIMLYLGNLQIVMDKLLISSQRYIHIDWLCL